MRFLPILTTFLAISQGCISSSDDESEERKVLELRAENSAIFIDKPFVDVYLKTFGYLKDVPESVEVSEVEQLKNQKEKFGVALKSFQEFMGIPSSGKVDSATQTLITKKRCSNKDQSNPSDSAPIWDKLSLKFNISKYPTNLKQKDFEELLQQAFSAWETVIPVDFISVDDAKDADIIFRFENPNDFLQVDQTHLSVGGAFESGQKAKIWISDSEAWDSDSQNAATKTDLFNVLVHEIGHILGLQHSQDSESTMYPIFERNPDERPRVTSNDVEKLRNLYGVGDETGSTVGTVEEANENCPKTVDSVTQATNGDFLLFKGDRVWQAVNNSIIAPSTETFQIFPGGPSYVNASATVGQSIILVSDREIYAFVQNEHEAFVLAPDYPKVLHSRVLFYPESAFPLANGSLILISGNVFATYDLDQNVPTMLNDKTVYFPNLPDDLRGGIPGSDYVYLMFTSDSVKLYDFSLQQIVDTKPLTEYFICDL
uniref:Peptidase metallopeptidase domain-containing protein n=1 Tax=Panagrolaimus sp. JU765 TaxID=591449 RepID=A0AC34R7T5_9BILA